MTDAFRLRRQLLRSSFDGACFAVGGFSFLSSTAYANQVMPSQEYWRNHLRTADGLPLVLEQQAKRWTLINLWASWCPPCLEEMPDLAKLDKHRRALGLNVIGVAQDWVVTTPAEPMPSTSVQKVLQRFQINYPILPGSDENLRIFGDKPTVPTSVLIQPNGRVFARHSGALTDDMVLKAIGKKYPVR